MNSESVSSGFNSCFVLKCSEVGLRLPNKAYPPPYRNVDSAAIGLNRSTSTSRRPIFMHYTDSASEKQLRTHNVLWKPIAGFENYYEVSNTGYVRRIKTQRVLRPSSWGNGYKGLTLCVDGIRHRFWVHILVARAFLPPAPEGYVVNHINNDPSDNHVSNLEYLTHKDNIQHAVIQGRMGKYKITQSQAKEIVGYLNQTSPRLSIIEISKMTGLPRSVIHDIDKNRRVLTSLMDIKCVQDKSPKGNRARKIAISDLINIRDSVRSNTHDVKQISATYNISMIYAWKLIRNAKHGDYDRLAS